MATMFCCSLITPYRPQRLLHEPKFQSFTSWAAYPKESTLQEDAHETDIISVMNTGGYVIQLVQQVNYGPLESKRYFLSTAGTDLTDREEAFVEVTEKHLVDANFTKLNAYKNFKCTTHNKFFELNVYQKDPVNQHHWRVNVARPGSEIDL